VPGRSLLQRTPQQTPPPTNVGSKAGLTKTLDTNKRRSVRSRVQKAHRPNGQRQGHAIGNYIPDFVCIKKKLIIELDGSQHLEQEEYDQERTEYLEELRYRVLRFWNKDVLKDVESVLFVIMAALRDA
jgi:very-short-patch-repair endonuclease